MLLKGQQKVRIWALVRAGLGLLVFGGIHLASGQTLVLLMQVALSASVILLLIGWPGKARLAIACSAAGFYFLLSGLGLLVVTTGWGGGTRMLWSLQSELAGDPVGGLIAGVDAPYQLQIPDSGLWYHRSPEKVQSDNADADIWLVRPDQDAHVMVIAEFIPGDGEVMLTAFTSAVMDNVRAATSHCEILQERSITGPPRGTLLNLDATIDGMDFQYWYGLFAEGDWAIQVICFSSEEAFEDVDTELRAIASSLSWQ
jgi:hypothetical protein